MRFYYLGMLGFMVVAMGCTRPQAQPEQSPILVALQANGYYDTITAINAAGGLGIYEEAGPAAKTIFSPTQAGWTAFATSIGYASSAVMLSEMPPATIKALLLYNCLPIARTSSEIRASVEVETCFKLDNAATTLSLSNEAVQVANREEECPDLEPILDPTKTALRDAACTAVTIRYPDLAVGEFRIHGTDRVAVGPGILPVLDMLSSNPFLNKEVVHFGTSVTDLVDSLSGVKTNYTVFVPTDAGLDSAISKVSRKNLGLTSDQIGTLLQYQVVTPALSGQTAGRVPTLFAGRSLTINSAGAPRVQTSVSSDSTIERAVPIIKAHNVGSDGNNIYCVEDMLFTRLPNCVASSNRTKALTTCDNFSQSEEDCLAVKIMSSDDKVSASACAFTPPSCQVSLENEAINCELYGNADPIDGSVCNQYGTFCTWVPPVPPETTGSCNPNGGNSTDAEVCASFVLEANCNSVLNPSVSMCFYSSSLCRPVTNEITSACALLNKTECTSVTGEAPYNGEFCALK